MDLLTKRKINRNDNVMYVKHELKMMLLIKIKSSIPISDHATIKLLVFTFYLHMTSDF